MKPKTASSMPASLRLSVLLYGATGSGKTTWAARTPRPLVLLTESQGIASIRLANPDAEILVIDKWSEFRDIWMLIMISGATSIGNAIKIEWPDGDTGEYDTIVLDSLTDLQALQHAEMLDLNSTEQLDVHKGTALTLPQWGRSSDILAALLRQQRSLPCNVVVLAMMEERYDTLSDGREMRRCIPLMRGKQLVPIIGGFFSAVGYLTRNSTGEPVVCWKNDPRFSSKPAPGEWPDVSPASLNPGVGTLGTLMRGALGPGVALAPGDEE